jgi:hypothetical protein
VPASCRKGALVIPRQVQASSGHTARKIIKQIKSSINPKFQPNIFCINSNMKCINQQQSKILKMRFCANNEINCRNGGI